MTANPHWLNPKRLAVYPRILLGVFVLAAAGWLLRSKNMVDTEGKPLGADFITFWAASLAALRGHATDAYSPAALFHYEQIAVPASHKVFAWFYPPAFFLVVLPLALLPYTIACLLWIASTLTAYVAVFRRVVRGGTAMWCLAAFSGLWINLLHGQNAFLTAGLAAAAILCLKRRPWLAGVFVGLLAIKPHLALLFPVALLAIGAWRTILSAFLTALAFTAAATAVLGTGILKACAGGLATARQFLEDGNLPWAKMPTPFAFARLLHLPVPAAYALQGAAAVVGTAVVWRVWRRSTDWQLRGTVLMSATFLISPYVFDYDLAWLAFPIAWLALKGVRDGWLRGEREVLVVAWLLPFLMAPIASATSLQTAPFALIALLWIVLRRVALETQPAPKPEPILAHAVA